jgi:NRAMP (natural resistance-associated macrophage protein)-like metal ion transporter
MDKTDTHHNIKIPPWLDHRGRPHSLQRLNRLLRIVGPGLITGAADDDPSGIGTYSQAGAAFGTGLLWLALYSLPLVITVQEMCGRIGLVTHQGIAGVIRRHYSRPLLYGIVLLLFIANTINVGADLEAMAATTSLLVPQFPAIPIVIFYAVTILLLEIFIPYRFYARVLKILTLSIFAYILTGIIIGPNWGELLHSTIIPQIDLTPAFLALVIGVLGTTISPYLFFWQTSEEVEEQALHHHLHNGGDPARERLSLMKQIQGLRIDTIGGMVASVTTFWFIVMATGLTLHQHGITNITTPAQAAAALEPLVRSFPNAGTLAKSIFALGVLGTGLLAIPILAGSAAYGVAESFGWQEGLSQSLRHARGFYAIIAASTLVGSLLSLLGINPIAALVYTAIINGFIAVPLLIMITIIANNRTIMGEFTNGKLSNIVAAVAILAMSLAALVTIGMFVFPIFNPR